MQIIFGKENAEALREKYIVLELETIQLEDGQKLEAYCLVGGDVLSLSDLPSMEQWIKLHADFIEGVKNGHHDYCRQCIDHLTGKFAGELDSFYEEILRRIDQLDPKDA